MPGILYLTMRADHAVRFPAWIEPVLQVSIALMLAATAFMVVTVVCDALGVKLPW